MSAWMKCSLGDVLTLKRGYDLPTAERKPGTYPIISSGGVSGYHSSYMVEGPGVITGRYGTIGEVFFVEGKFWPLNTSLYVKDFKGNDPRFICYFLRTLDLGSQNVAGAVPGLNRNALHKMQVVVPRTDIQRKIAAILSAYDELIENNQRRITLLEKMAEELYREWFVRLRFPGCENVHLIKGVPEGWHEDLSSAFFGLVKGKSYSSHELNDGESGMPFITLKSFQRGGGYREEGLKYYSGKFRSDQVVKRNDIVMAVTDMTQDRVVIGRAARVPDTGPDGAVISLDVIKLVPKGINSTFLYGYLRHSGFGEFIKEFANGANVLHLKPDLVLRQRVVMPPAGLQTKFSKIAEPIYAQLDKLSLANKNLAYARSALLPRLISGKLVVDNLNIRFPPSMQEHDSLEPDPVDCANGIREEVSA